MHAALAGLSPNVSAAIRALLLVGLDSAGYALNAALKREALLLVAGGEIDARLVAALEGLLGERRTGVGHLSYRAPIAEQIEQEADDPLATVGINV